MIDFFARNIHVFWIALGVFCIVMSPFYRVDRDRKYKKRIEEYLMKQGCHLMRIRWKKTFSAQTTYEAIYGDGSKRLHHAYVQIFWGMVFFAEDTIIGVVPESR